MPDEPTLSEVYRAVLRIEKVLITGNGQPPLVTKVAKLEEQQDALEALLAYDRQQIDNLREQARVSVETAKGAARHSGRWGAAAGGVVSLIAGVLIAIAETVGKRP